MSGNDPASGGLEVFVMPVPILLEVIEVLFWPTFGKLTTYRPIKTSLTVKPDVSDKVYVAVVVLDLGVLHGI